MRPIPHALVLLALTGVLAVRPGNAEGPASLVRDINTLENPSSSSNFGVLGALLPAGEKVVFPGYVAGSGAEPWTSDGTSLGTRLVRDIVPGPSSPGLTPLGSVRGAAVFIAEDSDRRVFELWRSDGSAQGTVRLAEWTGDCFDGPQPVVAGALLFFRAGGNGSRCWLWRTDGTAAGTMLLKNDPEPVYEPLAELTPAAGRLFFFAGHNLWISDGTREGTVLLRRFDEDTPVEMIAAGSRAFFIARAPGGVDDELWTSDGTAAGTRALSRFFEPHPFRSVPSRSLVSVVESILYFHANDGTGFDLWQSDGTAAGTRRVTDFVDPSPLPGFPLDSANVIRLGQRLVFGAYDARGRGLWTSRGTPETTAPVTGCPGGCPVGVGLLVPLGNRAVFIGYDGTGETFLWATDGTGGGTRRLPGLCPQGCSLASALFPLLGKAFFVVSGFGVPTTLWATDGTPEGTVRMTVLSASSDSTPFAPVQAGKKVFFAAQLDQRGRQLWTSDGTPRGTSLVSVIGGGSPASSPAGLVPLGGGVLFRACGGEMFSLWISDGTEAGTLPLPDTEDGACHSVIQPNGPVVAGGLGFQIAEGRYLVRTDGTAAGTFHLTPPDGLGEIRELTALGSRAIFSVDTSRSGFPAVETAFWESDGTVAGTRLLFPAGSAHFPHELKSLGGRLFFLARDLGSDVYGDQLWTSNGTAPPVRLTGVDNPFLASEPLLIAQVGTSFFFAAERRLWKTDGTAAGTVPVPFAASTEGYSPTDLTAFQGALYFVGGTSQGGGGRGLWRSDGTAAGTSLIHLVQPGSFEPEPALLRAVGDRLFLVAGDSEHGRELWSSDGTAAGTRMVRDLTPGEASSPLSQLTAAGGRLYFSAGTAAGGVELWQSDGTAAGTRLVQDIAPGADSSNPQHLTLSGDRLFFAADDGQHGEELWALPLQGGGCTASAEALCLGGRFRVEADWRDFEGKRGKGRAVALTADTGTFWFFDAANVEVILKLLDGRGVNGHHWVFYGALSNVEYALTVTDTQTGAVRRYLNPPGRLGSVADTEAFGPRGASAAGVITLGPAPIVGEAIISSLTSTAEAACAPSSTRLCLNNGRFAVEVRWKAQGRAGTGKAVPLPGGDTGYFWFFDANNVEVVLKVLDGRPLNGKFWVFYGALSDVEYTLTVTDTVTGAVKTYTNPQGRLASVADTGAF